MSKLSKVAISFASIILVASSVSAGVMSPTVVAAKKLDLYNPKKHYADEKKVIADPASRCNTADMRKLRDQALQQAKTYASKYGITDATAGVAKDAYNEYRNGVSVAWEAIEEPYCGFGAFGVTAVRKSLVKSLSHLQSNFLARMKGKAADKGLGDGERAIQAAATLTEAKPAEETKQAEKKAVELKSVVFGIKHKLEEGAFSAEVRELQELLAKDKTLYPEAVVSGYFGELTKKAVVRFQLKHKIIKSKSEDGAGVVGPKTRAAIEETF